MIKALLLLSQVFAVSFGAIFSIKDQKMVLKDELTNGPAEKDQIKKDLPDADSAAALLRVFNTLLTEKWRLETYSTSSGSCQGSGFRVGRGPSKRTFDASFNQKDIFLPVAGRGKALTYDNLITKIRKTFEKPEITSAVFQHVVCNKNTNHFIEDNPQLVTATLTAGEPGDKSGSGSVTFEYEYRSGGPGDNWSIHNLSGDKQAPHLFKITRFPPHHNIQVKEIQDLVEAMAPDADLSNFAQHDLVTYITFDLEKAAKPKRPSCTENFTVKDLSNIESWITKKNRLYPKYTLQEAITAIAEHFTADYTEHSLNEIKVWIKELIAYTRFVWVAEEEHYFVFASKNQKKKIR